MRRLALVLIAFCMAPALAQAHEMEVDVQTAAEPEAAADAATQHEEAVHTPYYRGANFNMKLLVGGRRLADAAWSDYRQQIGFGADFDVRNSGWPVSVFLSVSGAVSGSRSAGTVTTNVTTSWGGTNTYNDRLSISGYMGEMDFGLRRYMFHEGPFSPYFSVGMAMMVIGVQDDYRSGWDSGGWGHHGGGWRDNSYDDFTYGLFLNAGFDLRLNHGLVGFDVRGVVGSPKVNIVHPNGTINGRGDYVQISVTFGFGI